ncbi:MAG: hypothetical protein QNL33_07890 [Akkermansiaceae bacterium]|jgi:hypothetical protein
METENQTTETRARLLDYATRIDKPELLHPLIEETDQLERIFKASITTVRKRQIG